MTCYSVQLSRGRQVGASRRECFRRHLQCSPTTLTDAIATHHRLSAKPPACLAFKMPLALRLAGGIERMPVCIARLSDHAFVDG